MDIENEYGTLNRQKYLLPILIDIDAFCRKHGIKYSISDGTLLGAVRHKGFIPWDDDIDISMDRANFNRFSEAAKKDFPVEYEIIHDIWIRRISRKDNPNKNAFPPEGCIDIFLFDNMPDGAKGKIKVFLLKLLQGMIKSHVIYEGFSAMDRCKLFITHCFWKLFTLRQKLKWYDNVSQWGDEKNTTRIARFNGSFFGISNVRFSCGMIGSYEEMIFEGHNFMVMSGWEEFLKTLYGDYMKIPDKYNRTTSHVHIVDESK